MLTEYPPEESLPEVFREVLPTMEEANRFPAELRWAIRKELPPGHGVVWFGCMLISAPSPLS